MNKIKISFFALTVFLLGGIATYAKPNVGQAIPGTGHHKRLADGCAPATATVDLDINNVRARILNGGDMWWDLVALAKYEVPKVTQEGQTHRTSLFAGSLWIGGYDNSSLKEAAMTYRQNGSDFFPGPLDTINGGISGNECLKYDKIWKINKSDVDAFRAGGGTMTDDMTTWPGNPIDNNAISGQSFAHYLAPFKDVNGNGIYDPNPADPKNSDYPIFLAHTASGDCEFLPDQSLWFIYNDKGSRHSETNSNAIGLEVQTHAYAYITNDQLNSATFYASTIINRSTTKLDSTMFGEWVDPDLGYYADDFVGVDTVRSLGICYNGDNFDDGPLGYGNNLPAVGVDFFLGPKADDPKKDNNHDGVVDFKDKYLPMSNFVYYNNDFNRVNGNPEQASHYYFYLTARWKDGSIIKNDGKNGTGGGPRTHFMFTGDPVGNSGWTEGTAGNPPGDRRFLQSAGPFTLKPGAVNHVVVGAVWAQSSVLNNNTSAITELKYADDLAQKLFDDCFQLRIGPDAPVVDVTELDRKVVLSIINQNNSVNNTEKGIKVYGKKDTVRFEGYMIYQLKNGTVSAGEIRDATKARLVAEVDLKNSITSLVNYVFDPILKEVPQLMVTGQDSGISHTFAFNQDQFANGDKQMINNKFYYYMVFAYGVNKSDQKTPFLLGRPAVIGGNPQLKAVPHKPQAELGGCVLNSDYGVSVPVRRIEGVGNGGNSLELSTESIAELFGNPLKSKIDSPIYVKGSGPVNVKVYDPLRVPDGNFTFAIFDTNTNYHVQKNIAKDFTNLNGSKSKWTITRYDKTSGKKLGSYSSVNVMDSTGEQVIPELGLTVTINQVEGPSPLKDSIARLQNGFIEATIAFNDPGNIWLTGVQDGEQSGFPKGMINPFNWIRSGNYIDSKGCGIIDRTDDVYLPAKPNGSSLLAVDPRQVYETLLGGIIAPAGLAARSYNYIDAPATCESRGASLGQILSLGPIPSSTPNSQNFEEQRIGNINSVDIVFTSDRTKWTKCIVVEMGELASENEGGANKFDIRKHDNPFILSNGVPTYAPGQNTSEPGFSWFPGYAINIETGERLNIIFGEDSHLSLSDNGGDMLWNPSSNLVNPGTSSIQDYQSRYLWGGKHWIYVMGARNNTIVKLNPALTKAYPRFGKDRGVLYDSCLTYYNMLKDAAAGKFNANTTLGAIFASAMWVMPPLLNTGSKLLSPEEGLIPTETKIRLRVNTPYSSFTKSGSEPTSNYEQPFYRFSTDNVAPTVNTALGKKALELVNVVPNPYYAFSSYETGQLDSRVRITNLPRKCTIKIYTVDGSLVRRYDLDYPVSDEDPTHTSYLDWDLQNGSKVPIASGVYLIHINAGELGEKVIKWFGVMRPLDLNSF